LRRSETWRGVSPSSSASTSCATARRCSACTSARGWGGWGSLGRGWAQPPPSSFCPGQGGDPVRLPGASQSGAAAPQPALPGGAERVLAPAAAPRQGPAVSLGVRVPRAMGVPSEVPEHPTGPWCHVTHGGSPPLSPQPGLPGEDVPGAAVAGARARGVAIACRLPQLSAAAGGGGLGEQPQHSPPPAPPTRLCRQETPRGR